jgi:DNA-binding PadR family transcriptional regulator
LLSTVDNAILSTMDSQWGLNPTEAALLGLLREHGPMTGSQLAQTAQAQIGEYWNLTRSQIYRELTALTDSRFLAAGAPDSRGSRVYAVTSAGEAAFLEWLQVSPADMKPRLPLLITVRFGADLPPGRLAEILGEHERRHRERLAEYRALDAELARIGVGPYGRATIALGIRYEEAVLQWFADLPAEIRQRGGC